MALRNLSRKDEMIEMRKTMTLQEIADKFSVSRERVRQIIGNTGRNDKTDEKILYVRANPQKTNSEIQKDLAKIYGKGLGSKISAAWGGMRHSLGGGWAKPGSEIENLVSKKLTSLGIENKQMPHLHPFDIMLDNGLKVDVKASFIEQKTSKTQRHTMYGFSVQKNKRGDYCDFFICYIAKTGDYFIIPNNEVNTVSRIYIAWPTPERSWSKWASFHNRFDLLKTR